MSAQILQTDLGAFAKFQQASSNFIMPVCPSTHLHGTTQDLHEILYLSIFWKYVEKIQVSLKFDK